jgi:hypothetical protein
MEDGNAKATSGQTLLMSKARFIEIYCPSMLSLDYCESAHGSCYKALIRNLKALQYISQVSIKLTY